MVSNYIKVSYRNLVKYKSYTLLNILGLSVGMAAVLFISMYVIHEMSYDRFFPNADQIYRIGIHGNISGNSLQEAVTPAPMAKVLKAEIPQVKYVTRILPNSGMVRLGMLKFYEKNFYFSDSTFFQVFAMPLISGDPKNVLSKPYSVVITEETAKLYFGNESPLGKKLQIENDTIGYTITGIVKLPRNTHFHFDCLASISSLKWLDQQNWVVNYFYTYVLTEKGYTEKQLALDINNRLVLKYLVPQVEKAIGKTIDFFAKGGNTFTYIVQPLNTIHLHSNLQYELGRNVDASNVFIFIFAGIILLIIASINFMNLATARSASRAKEVGLRKIVGSQQKQLILQFIIESVFLSLVAFTVALVIVDILTPAYQKLIGQPINLGMFINGWFLTGVLLATIAIGVIAGSYPSFVMSSYHPIKIIKGDYSNQHQSPRLRNALVVLQFSASVILMLWTFTLYRQLSFMRHFNMGFAKEQILVIKRSQGLNGSKMDFMADLRKNQNILGFSTATHIPGKLYMNNAFFPKNQPNTTYLLNQSLVSSDFAQSLNLTLRQGHFFTSKDTFGCVINQAAVKLLGLKKPIGSKIYQALNNIRLTFTVVGVVEDFNFKSLRYPIEPMIMTLMHNRMDGYILVRISTTEIPKTIDYIKGTWEKYAKDYPFDFYWMNEDFDQLYSSEALMASLLLAFSIISIFIASLGLFGLIAFTSLKRTREIGIRKTMGATTTSIAVMLTKNSVLPVLLSLVIAWPIAFVINHIWLKAFSYRIPFNYMDYFYSALIAIFIAISTVIIQAMKAARKNPSQSIKYE